MTEPERVTRLIQALTARGWATYDALSSCLGLEDACMLLDIALAARETRALGEPA